MTTPGSLLPQAVRTAVVERLPSADVQNAALLGEGIATRAYQVDDPSGTWVIRVSTGYPEPWRWRGGRAYEVPLLEALASRGLQVPRDPFSVLAEDGLPVAIVERRVAGQPLTSPPSGKRRNLLARQLASFLTVLHRIPIAEADALGVPRSSVAVEARQHLDLAEPFLSAKVCRWLDQEISSLDQQEVPTALVHTDIRAEHLYLDAKGDLVGVIDFGDAAIGDPARDFAKLAGDFGDSFVRLLLSCCRSPAAEAILARAQLYRRLETLWEVAEDAWGDRPSAVRRLRSLAAAATRARQARSV